MFKYNLDGKTPTHVIMEDGSDIFEMANRVLEKPDKAKAELGADIITHANTVKGMRQLVDQTMGRNGEAKLNKAQYEAVNAMKKLLDM